MTSPTIRTASPGPGNGWRCTISSGRPSSAPTCAHLVLEQVAQRLDQLEVHVLGQAAHVVVALDVGGGLRAGLDHVGVQRALHEEPRARVLARDLLEHADELLADRLALGLGVGDARELREEPVLRPSRARAARGSAARTSPRPGRARPRGSGRGRRTRTSAGPRPRGAPAAPRPRSRRRRDSAQSTSASPTWSRIRAHLLVDDVRRRPVGQQPAARRTGTASSRPGRAACARPPGGTAPRTARARGPPSPRSGSHRCVAVTRNPSGARVTASPWLIQTVSRRRAGPAAAVRARVDVQLRAAVLAVAGRADLAAERLRHQLVAVADAEHRHAELEQRRDRPAAPSGS